MKNKNDPKKSRKNIISQSVNSSFSKSSFIELRDGTIKRIRHKQSYKDLFLEKRNFVPTECLIPKEEMGHIHPCIKIEIHLFQVQKKIL